MTAPRRFRHPGRQGAALEGRRVNGLGHQRTMEVITTTPKATEYQGVQHVVGWSSDKVDVVFGPSSSGEGVQTTRSSTNEGAADRARRHEKLVNDDEKYVFNSVPTDRVLPSRTCSPGSSSRRASYIAAHESAAGYGRSGKNVAGVAAVE